LKIPTVVNKHGVTFTVEPVESHAELSELRKVQAALIQASRSIRFLKSKYAVEENQIEPQQATILQSDDKLHDHPSISAADNEKAKLQYPEVYTTPEIEPIPIHEISHPTVSSPEENLSPASAQFSKLLQETQQGSQVVDLTPDLLNESKLLVGYISDLMAIAIAAHQEYIKANPLESSEYLLDAAGLVTLAIIKLISVIQNNEGDEALTAAAATVKGTVARLVTSAKVKLHPGSHAGNRLTQTANQIYGATQKIADIVHAKQEEEEVQVKIQTSQLQYIRQRDEARQNVQKAELELQNARKDLAKLSKEKQGSYKNVEAQKNFIEITFRSHKKVADLQKNLCHMKKIQKKIEERKTD